MIRYSLVQMIRHSLDQMIRYSLVHMIRYSLIQMVRYRLVQIIRYGLVHMNRLSLVKMIRYSRRVKMITYSLFQIIRVKNMAYTILNLSREGLDRGLVASKLWEVCAIPTFLYATGTMVIRDGAIARKVMTVKDLREC